MALGDPFRTRAAALRAAYRVAGLPVEVPVRVYQTHERCSLGCACLPLARRRFKGWGLRLAPR